jgi:hypothetical protein
LQPYKTNLKHNKIKITKYLELNTKVKIFTKITLVSNQRSRMILTSPLMRYSSKKLRSKLSFKDNILTYWWR